MGWIGVCVVVLGISRLRRAGPRIVTPHRSEGYFVLPMAFALQNEYDRVPARDESNCGRGQIAYAMLLRLAPLTIAVTPCHLF